MPVLSTEGLLMVISAISGVFLLACTMLLVGLRRIYFDQTTKEPILIEIPLIGKLRTQAPALALIFVGAVLVVYPTMKTGPDMVTIDGDVSALTKSMNVVVVAEPTFEQTLNSSSHYHLRIPALKDTSFRVKFIVDKEIIADQYVSVVKGSATLKPLTYEPPPEERTLHSRITPKKEVSDAKLRSLGIIQ
jgi:hypothetical protein